MCVLFFERITYISLGATSIYLSRYQFMISAFTVLTYNTTLISNNCQTWLFFIKKNPCIIHGKLWYFGARKSILVITLMQFCIIKDRNVTSSYRIFISLACFFVLLIHNEFTLFNKQRNQCERSHYVLHTKLQLLSF